MSALPIGELPGSFEPHSFKVFWNQSGNASGFRRHELASLWLPVMSQYGDLDVHNFDHAAKEVLPAALHLADEYEKQPDAEPVRRRPLTIAALLHDAGYHLDHKALGYDSPEDLSTAILQAEPILDSFEPEEAQLATSLIQATKAGARPRTIEERIIVRADLDNIGTDGFWLRTGQLATEAKYLKESRGQVFLGDIHAANNIKALAAYLEIGLTPPLGDFDEPWRQKAFLNFGDYLIDRAQKMNMKPQKFAAQLGTIVMQAEATAASYALLAAEVDADPTDQAAS